MIIIGLLSTSVSFHSAYSFAGILKPICKLWIVHTALAKPSRFTFSASSLRTASRYVCLSVRAAQKLRLDQLVIQQGHQQQVKGGILIRLLHLQFSLSGCSCQ